MIFSTISPESLARLAPQPQPYSADRQFATYVRDIYHQTEGRSSDFMSLADAKAQLARDADTLADSFTIRWDGDTSFDAITRTVALHEFVWPDPLEAEAL